jgi:DNA polymerase epsilon subunit 1
MFSLKPRQIMPIENTPAPADIEDLGALKSNNQSAKNITITQQKSSTAKRKYAEITADKETSGNWLDILGPPPKYGNSKSEFITWLNYHKRKWQIQLASRKQDKRDLAKSQDVFRSNAVPGNISRSITDFVHKSATSRAQKPWQIINICDTNMAGQFKMWILVENDLYAVSLKMTRTFYVNQLKPPEKESVLCRKANKHLPRSQCAYNLYEYSMPEDVFQKHQNEIMNEFSNANVEGVYELNVPLMFSLLMKLGCVCSLKKTSKFKGFDSFEVNELESRNDVEYLTTNTTKTIFLFIHFNATKMIIGMFQSASNTVQVFVLDSVRNSNMPNLSNLLNAEREKRVNAGIGEEFLPSASQKFDIKVETNEAKVYKALERSLSAYKDEKRGATMILLQSNIDDTELKENVPTLDEFPIVKFNVAEKAGLFNCLDWQKVAAKHMIGHFMNSITIFANMVEQSRYYQVPIGNLPKDASLYACDLFYARHLYKSNYVLWCSPTSIPDLGGKQYDDYRLIQNSAENGSNICVQMNNPGFYQNICLDLEITSLSISALLQLTKINEFEGASAVNFSAAPQTSLEQMMTGDMGTGIYSSYYDEAALCLSSLRIMKSMVQYWLKDIALYGNAFADMQVIHFYRWLQSPGSLLYDPAIRRTLQSYMKKLCLLLVNELKRLGAHVVYADLSRIIVCTNKFELEDALNYLKYLLSNTQSKDLFSTIHIEPSKIWNVLLWQDSVRFILNILFFKD